jgi:hypothetical protein
VRKPNIWTFRSRLTVVLLLLGYLAVAHSLGI